jgi:serine/threonine protein kinase
VLLEYCGDFSLDRLTDHVPSEYWQTICDDAVSIVNSISHHDILNKDVKPENFVVRRISSSSDAKYEPVMIDFTFCRFRQDEEGAVGSVMQKILRKRGDDDAYNFVWRK